MKIYTSKQVLRKTPQIERHVVAWDQGPPRMQERVQIDGEERVVYSCKRILQGEHVGDYEIIVRRA